MKTFAVTLDERRLLQICILVAGCVPVGAGTAGVVFGSQAFSESADVSFDSHFRYLSGLLLAIGIAFWAAIPAIERRTMYIRLLTFIVVVGGAARLAAALLVGVPSHPMLLAIAMELLITPLLCLWQGRISRLRKYRASEADRPD